MTFQSLEEAKEWLDNYLTDPMGGSLWMLWGDNAREVVRIIESVWHSAFEAGKKEAVDSVIKIIEKSWSYDGEGENETYSFDEVKAIKEIENL